MIIGLKLHERDNFRIHFIPHSYQSRIAFVIIKTHMIMYNNNDVVKLRCGV